MAKIIKRTKKDGTCSYCIRVSNGYDWQGRQVLVNRTFTPPPGLTGKKLEKELQRQADAFEQEVHSGISLDASMKLDNLIERWFTEYADRQLKPKTATEYRKLVPRVSAALGHMKVNQIRPAHLMAFYTNLSEDGVRQDSTYTATAALLKLLPKGQRARIREAAGVGEETMRGLCSGKPVSAKRGPPKRPPRRWPMPPGCPCPKPLPRRSGRVVSWAATRSCTITAFCRACLKRRSSGN